MLHQDILRWLFALHLRAPGCSVMLVANKCDGSIADFRATAEMVQARVTELLRKWNRRRGGLRYRPFTPPETEVNLLPRPSLVSCRDGGGLPDMIGRVADHGAASMSVPPSWGLALEFLAALRKKRSPLRSAREYLGLDASSDNQRPEDVSEASLITKASLSKLWNDLVQRITGELRSDAEKMVVADTGGALEGALWIR